MEKTNTRDFRSGLKTMFYGLLIIGILSVLGMNVSADVCYCDSCANCTNTLNNNSCTEVKLTADILNHSGTCIDDPENFNNKVFDCQGHTIDGDYS